MGLVFETVMVQVCYSQVSDLDTLVRCGGISYASACSARVEGVGRRGLAEGAEGALRDAVAVAVEGEGNLVADCSFDAGGGEGEAAFGNLDLVDAVHELAMMLAMFFGSSGYVRCRSERGESDGAEDGELHFE